MMYSAVVRREDAQENTFAFVQWKGVLPDHFLDKLKAAVREWKKTPDGERAWKDSGGEFNISDLADYVHEFIFRADEKDLMDYQLTLKTVFVQQGITYLDIQVYSDGDPLAWKFDDVLM